MDIGTTKIARRDGSEHVFRLGTTEICKVEEELNVSITEIFDDLRRRKVRLITLRAFVMYASVPALDAQKAAALIDEVGALPITDVLTDAIIATFNAARRTNTDGKEAPANPTAPSSGSKGSRRRSN